MFYLLSSSLLFTVVPLISTRIIYYFRSAHLILFRHRTWLINKSYMWIMGAGAIHMVIGTIALNEQTSWSCIQRVCLGFCTCEFVWKSFDLLGKSLRSKWFNNTHTTFSKPRKGMEPANKWVLIHYEFLLKLFSLTLLRFLCYEMTSLIWLSINWGNQLIFFDKPVFLVLRTQFFSHNNIVMPENDVMPEHFQRKANNNNKLFDNNMYVFF